MSIAVQILQYLLDRAKLAPSEAFVDENSGQWTVRRWGAEQGEVTAEFAWHYAEPLVNEHVTGARALLLAALPQTLPDLLALARGTAATYCARTVADPNTPELFRLNHPSGLWAYAVRWADGSCIVHGCDGKTVTMADGAELIAAYAASGTRFRVVQHPYDTGREDAARDFAQNTPFVSIGGPSRRDYPTFPTHITADNRMAWWSGYRDTCQILLGPEWQTGEFPTLFPANPPDRSPHAK